MNVLAWVLAIVLDCLDGVSATWSAGAVPEDGVEDTIENALDDELEIEVEDEEGEEDESWLLGVGASGGRCWS